MRLSLFAGVTVTSILLLVPVTGKSEPFETRRENVSFPTSDSAAASREANRRAQNARNSSGRQIPHNRQPQMADVRGGANMLLGGTRPHTNDNSRNRNRQHGSGRDHRRYNNDGDHRRYGTGRDHRRYGTGRDHRRYGRNRDHHRYGTGRDHRRYGRDHSRTRFSLNIFSGYGLGHGGYGYGLGYGRNFRDHGYYSLLGGHHYRSGYSLYPWWYGDTVWGYRTRTSYRTGYGHIGHSNVFCSDPSHEYYAVNWQYPSNSGAFSPYSRLTNGSYGGYEISSCRIESKRDWFEGRRAVVQATVCWDDRSRRYVDTGARQLLNFY